MSRCICCLFLALCVSLVFPAYSDGGVVWSYNDREAYADYGGNGVILGSDTKTDAGPTVEPTTLTASIGSGSLAASANATVSTNHTEASGVHTFTGSGSTTLYSYLSNYSY